MKNERKVYIVIGRVDWSTYRLTLYDEPRRSYCHSDGDILFSETHNAVAVREHPHYGFEYNILDMSVLDRIALERDLISTQNWVTKYWVK